MGRTEMKYFCLSLLCFMLEALDTLKDDEEPLFVAQSHIVSFVSIPHG